MRTKIQDKIIVNQVNKKWKGGIIPAAYDFFMVRNVIPKKMNASVTMHNMIIRNELAGISGQVLELASGSGNLSGLINCNLDYKGVDISLGLLKLASKKFSAEGFENYRLYCCEAEKLPFEDDTFDCCVSNLSLNFFSDTEKVLSEAVRVLKRGALFFGSVPVPERNSKGSLIRGNLYTETELERIFSASGFAFKAVDIENGAILYFRAVKC